jgi:hypothetical protein
VGRPQRVPDALAGLREAHRRLRRRLVGQRGFGAPYSPHTHIAMSGAAGSYEPERQATHVAGDRRAAAQPKTCSARPADLVGPRAADSTNAQLEGLFADEFVPAYSQPVTKYGSSRRPCCRSGRLGQPQFARSSRTAERAASAVQEKLDRLDEAFLFEPVPVSSHREGDRVLSRRTRGIQEVREAEAEVLETPPLAEIAR